jgi:3-oxoadipate enol-lactonase
VTAAVAVHHVVAGPQDAPTLVLSNSLGSTLAMWDPQIPVLARHRRVVRYDLRGHGRSPVPPGPYDIADLGADLIDLLERVGAGRADLCGLSLGGQVSMWLAANAPERVGRLVLCSTSPRFEPSQAWADRAALVRAHGTEAVADTVVGRWFTPAFATAHPEVVAEMRAMIASTPTEGYAACCGVVERTDLRPSLPSIRAATLAIAGADDPAAPPVQAELIAAGIPDCRVVVVRGAAHLANIERADRVTDLVLQHLLATSIKEDP